MTNKEIQNYQFNDIDLDSMQDFDYFDYCARAALIERKITKDDYLLIEVFRSQYMDTLSRLSKPAREKLKQIVSNL